MDWKNSFDRQCLKEGWRLEQAGRVGPLFRDGNLYSAVVDGRYLVEAKIDDGEILSIECSCPTAHSGNLCPHEAAFLFKAEGTGNLFGLPSKPHSSYRSEAYRQPDTPFKRPLTRRNVQNEHPFRSAQPETDDFSQLLRQLFENENSQMNTEAKTEMDQSLSDSGSPDTETPAAKTINPSEAGMTEPITEQTPVFEQNPISKSEQADQVQKAIQNPGRDHPAENKEAVTDKQEGIVTSPLLTRAEQLVSTMDSEALRRFIVRYAQRKPEFEDALLIASLPDHEQIYDQLEQKVLKKADDVLNREATHPQKKANLDDLIRWLDECIEWLLDQNDPYHAIRLLEGLVEHNGQHAHPFNLDAVRNLDRFCLDRLFMLVQTVRDDSLIEEVFSWMEQHDERQDLLLIEKELNELLIDPVFSRPSLLLAQLKVMENTLEKLQTTNATIWDKEEVWKLCANFLERADLPLNERQQFENRYGMNSELLIARAQIQLENQNPDKALHSLKLADRLHATPSEMITKARLKAQAFQALGQAADEKEQLKLLALLYMDAHQSELKRLIELSEDEELEDLYEQLDRKVDVELRTRLYRDLNETERLFALMEKEGTLDLMISIGQALEKADSHRTASLWLKLAQRQLDHPAGTTDYRLIAYAMAQAAKDPTVKPEARQAAQALKKAHPRSQNLHVILEQAGL